MVRADRQRGQGYSWGGPGWHYWNFNIENLVIKKFDASQRSKYWLPLAVLPATLLFIWVGTKVFAQGHYLVGAAFILLAVLFAVFLVFQLTVRVDIEGHSVTRSWLLGRTVVPMEEITRLSWARARGVLIFTIRYGRKSFIQLSNYAFTESELRGIQHEVIAARGFEGQPLPPMFEGQAGDFDLAEMSESKNKMHEATPKATGQN